MHIATNCDSEPFSLINTKRQIFNSDHDKKMKEYFQKAHSKDDFDDSAGECQNNLKYIQQIEKNTRRESVNRPHTINIQHVEPYKRETLIFENFISEPRTQQGFHPVWKKGSLTIIKLVARFLYQLKTKAETLKLKLMNFHMFQYIDDKASDFLEFKMAKQSKNTSLKQKFLLIMKKMQGIFNFIQHLLCYLVNKITVISPESTFKIVWDSTVVFFIIINIFFIPMSLSFDLDKSSTLIWLFFETIPSYVFIFEIILNFNTAFYSQGRIHTQRSQIFNHYVQENFWWDLVIAIPYLFAQLDIPYIQFVLLLRITRVKSMVQNVEDVLNLKESVQAVLELTKLIYFIVFVAHMCSCAWHLLGKIEMDVYGDTKSWLVHYGYYDQPWHKRYIVSIYWSVITTLTVGYGDIVPQTSIEQLFVVIVAMIICGVFGYTISTIGEILRNLEEKKSEFKFLMKEVHSYIKEKQLSLQLSLKVRKYFEFYYQTQLFQKKSYQTVLKNLSEQLKQEIMIDLHKKTLISCKFINETMNDNLVNDLCQKVQQETYGPGDDIIDIKTQHEKKLIFIIDGQVESYFYCQGLSKFGVSNQNSGKFSRTYKKGDILGELEFITNSDYSVQYKAKVFTQVASITRHDLLEIIRENKESAYKFQKLIDTLTYSKTLGRACEICKWTHFYYNCPFTFYQPNIWKIVRQSQESMVPKRQEFVRKPNAQKFRTKANSQMTMASIIEFMLHKNFVQEELLGSKLLRKFGFNYTNRLSQREIQDIKSESSSSGSGSSKQSSKSDNKLYNGSIQRNQRYSQSSSIEKLERMKSSHMKDSLQNNNNHNQNNYLKPILTRLNSIGQSNLNHEDFNNTPTLNQKKFPYIMTKKSSISNIKGFSKTDAINNQNEADTTKGTLKLQDIGPFNLDIDTMMIDENDFYPQYHVQNVIEIYNKNRIRTISQIKKRKFHDKLKSIRLQKSFNTKLISPRLSQQII